MGNMSWGTCRGYMLWVQKDIHPRHTPTTYTHDIHSRHVPTTCTHDIHPRHTLTTCTHDMHPRHAPTICCPRDVTHDMLSTRCSQTGHHGHSFPLMYPRHVHLSPMTCFDVTHELCTQQQQVILKSPAEKLYVNLWSRESTVGNCYPRHNLVTHEITLVPTRCTHEMYPRHAPTTCTHDMLSTRCYPRYVVHEMFTN